MSKVIEAIFDEIEFRLARRAFRQAVKRKANKRFRNNVLNNHSMATSSRSLSVRAARTF